MDKKEFRKTVRAKGINIESKILAYYLKSFVPFNESDQVLLYLALKDEVDLSFLLNEENCLVPYLDGDMYFTKYSSLLVKGMYNIDEPLIKVNEKIRDNAIAFIPGLAFDKNFNRLGRGKGYYDKFLKDKNIIKVGVIHSSLLFDEIPHEDHDVKMDYILTEKGIIKR